MDEFGRTTVELANLAGLLVVVVHSSVDQNYPSLDELVAPVGPLGDRLGMVEEPLSLTVGCTPVEPQEKPHLKLVFRLPHDVLEEAENNCPWRQNT